MRQSPPDIPRLLLLSTTQAYPTLLAPGIASERPVLQPSTMLITSQLVPRQHENTRREACIGHSEICEQVSRRTILGESNSSAASQRYTPESARVAPSMKPCWITIPSAIGGEEIMQRARTYQQTQQDGKRRCCASRSREVLAGPLSSAPAK